MRPSFSASVREELRALAKLNKIGRRAFIRACFITGGSVNAPGKSYHLEFTLTDWQTAQRLKDMLVAYDINAKIRTDQPIVYIKEADDIAQLLRITGASKSLLRFENERIKREVANDINRRVNFETANLNKTVSSAVKQVNDIKYIAEHAGLGYLSKPLEDVAKLRLEHETSSLHEIGALLSPPISKSGVNHRLRKISEIADELRLSASFNRKEENI